MKPFQILLFLLSVLVIPFAMSLFFPKEEEIRISEKISIHFISPDELFKTNTPEYADISSIINQSIVVRKNRAFLPAGTFNSPVLVIFNSRENKFCCITGA